MLRTLDLWGSGPHAGIRHEALMIWFSAIVGGQLTTQMELNQALVKVEDEVFPLGLIEMMDGLNQKEFERVRMDFVKGKGVKFSSDCYQFLFHLIFGRFFFLSMFLGMRMRFLTPSRGYMYDFFIFIYEMVVKHTYD